MDMAEFIIKMIVIGSLSVGIFGTIVQDSNFRGTVRSYDAQRMSIDFAQAVLSADCLVHEVNGEGRKGMFDSEKLDALDKKTSLCLKMRPNYFIEIHERPDGINGDSGGRLWTIGARSVIGEFSKFPIVIKYPNRIVAGEMIVRVQT